MGIGWSGARSEEELQPDLNPILINVVGVFGDLIIASAQVQVTPGKIELGGVSDRIAQARLGVPGVILGIVHTEAAEIGSGKEPQAGERNTMAWVPSSGWATVPPNDCCP